MGLLYTETGAGDCVRRHLRACALRESIGDMRGLMRGTVNLSVLAVWVVDFYLRRGQPGKAAAQMDRLAAAIAATYRHTARRPYWDAKLAAFRRALAAPDGRSSN